MYIVIRNIRKGTSYKYELYTAQELNLSKTPKTKTGSIAGRAQSKAQGKTQIQTEDLIAREEAVNKQYRARQELSRSHQSKSNHSLVEG